jgi:hypothetical protein
MVPLVKNVGNLLRGEALPFLGCETLGLFISPNEYRVIKGFLKAPILSISVNFCFYCGRLKFNLLQILEYIETKKKSSSHILS